MTTCPRCGKTNLDPDYPHTCTPPRALVLAELIDKNLAGAGDAEISTELRRLHAENEALRVKNNQMETEINTAWQEVKTEQRLSFRDQVAKLEAENDALRADAERYRWLRDQSGGYASNAKFTIYYRDGDWVQRVRPDDLDAAIDAARSKT